MLLMQTGWLDPNWQAVAAGAVSKRGGVELRPVKAGWTLA